MDNKPASTPAARWREEGEVDPHKGHYDGERSSLTLGDLTDDELANGAFMNYDRPLDIHAIMEKRPGYHSPIAWMTAVKDRIRWLSRVNEKLLAENAELRARLGGTLVLSERDSATVAAALEGQPAEPTEAMQRAVETRGEIK